MTKAGNPIGFGNRVFSSTAYSGTSKDAGIGHTFGGEISHHHQKRSNNPTASFTLHAPSSRPKNPLFASGHTRRHPQSDVKTDADLLQKLGEVLRLISDPRNERYETGMERVKDLCKELDMSRLRMFAEDGNPDAQFVLWQIASSDHGSAVDLPEAVRWLQLSAAQGHAMSLGSLGVMYLKGEGVDQNYKRALGLFSLAAEKNLAAAQFNLGNMYYGGIGVEKNVQEAAYWFKLAAEQGLAISQLGLGLTHIDTEDYDEAIKWLRLAAEGRGEVQTKAQILLGSIYYDVKKDSQESFRWLKLAAENGDPVTQYQLGKLYLRETEPNLQEALTWLERAAEQDFAKAQFLLGVLYFRAEKLPHDHHKALGYFRKAAEHGHAGAQGYLGAMYYMGLGVEVDIEKALDLFNLAAKNGDKTAISTLTELMGGYN